MDTIRKLLIRTFTLEPFLICVGLWPHKITTRRERVCHCLQWSRCRNLTTCVSFSVRKKELLGGRRPPQGLQWPEGSLMYTGGGLWPPKISWGGLWPSKSCIFLTENVSDKSLNTFCLALIPLSPSSGIIISFCVSKGDYKLLATFQRCFRGPSEPLVIL